MSSKQKVKFKDLIKGDKPVLVDFYATWCGPCKQLSPIVNSVRTDLEGKMKVIKVDVDKKKSVSNKYKVSSLPTLAIFQNGKIVWRESGMKTKAELMRVANHFIDLASSAPNDNTAQTTSNSKAEAVSVVPEKRSFFSRLFK